MDRLLIVPSIVQSAAALGALFFFNFILIFKFQIVRGWASSCFQLDDLIWTKSFRFNVELISWLGEGENAVPLNYEE